MPNGAIRLDGWLNEEAWRLAAPITDFVQKEPVEGAAPADRMEVRIAYDDDALYVGARMASSAPIQAPMGRRDEGFRAEHLVVSLDTYLDRRTASSFGITAAGVRLDSYYASDNEDDEDGGFDPVWDGRVAVEADGWTAELWIPFSQLRFNERDPQVWGLNIFRWIPSRNEEVYWALIPRTEQRWASLFGELHGISGIRPPRRLELLPYVAASARRLPGAGSENPFARGAGAQGRVGLDAKVGVGSNLTIEATVNPDFGQVEADPAVVNLTAFETFFSERRPFFLEGAQLLTGSVNNYFYSRRIGAPPPGRPAADFADQPAATTILGAGKLTGRLPSGTSIGLLGAVTAEEWARTFDEPNRFGRVRVAPRTTYGVARVEQEFGPPGSSIGVMTTMMHRDLGPTDPLAATLTRSAFSLSTDAVVRFRDGEYELNAYAGGSRVGGEPAAIDRLQRASARYLHRPDAAHLRYDPSRRSLSGLKAGASFARRTGRHWNWAVETEIETPEFETNDLGRTTSVDQVQANWRLEYRDTVPGPWWREYRLGVEQQQMWTTAGERERQAVGLGGEIEWPNYWELGGEFLYSFRAFDPRLTRGGPTMQTPAGWTARTEIENNSASRTRGELSLAYGRNEDGGLTFEIGSRLAVQPEQWQLAIEPRYERLVETQQYVTTLDGGPAAAYGGRYVFGHVDRSTYSTEIRFTYTFKPDLTLDFYGEPFAASGRYSGLGELAAARTRTIRRYGTGGTLAVLLSDGSLRVIDGEASFVLRNRDFNVRSFRSNLVLRWEWRPGSILYVVWQQDRSASEMSGSRASLADMFGAIGARGGHFFAVKTSLWVAPS